MKKKEIIKERKLKSGHGPALQSPVVVWLPLPEAELLIGY
jgi:hypothetical protein